MSLELLQCTVSPLHCNHNYLPKAKECSTIHVVQETVQGNCSYQLHVCVQSRAQSLPSSREEKGSGVTSPNMHGYSVPYFLIYSITSWLPNNYWYMCIHHKH